MSVLIGILITFLVVILVLYLINMLPLDGRAKQIAQIIVIIIGIIARVEVLRVRINRDVGARRRFRMIRV